ncbi:hypothetical protein I308_104372 [Cryptococcus tetragattii IND107]|uniref:Uncharacterized protein n=1 Tax=Cryptococcus tetragattii IND107 TaxID=1296105 RepID=A0ABR3BQ70_9TREE
MKHEHHHLRCFIRKRGGKTMVELQTLDSGTAYMPNRDPRGNIPPQQHSTGKIPHLGHAVTLPNTGIVAHELSAIHKRTSRRNRNSPASPLYSARDSSWDALSAYIMEDVSLALHKAENHADEINCVPEDKVACRGVRVRNDKIIPE